MLLFSLMNAMLLVFLEKLEGNIIFNVSLSLNLEAFKPGTYSY